MNAFAPDGLVARGQGGSWTQYAFDPQGSAAQRFDASGTLLSASVVDAFGRASTVGTWSDPWGYNARDGYYFDRESEYYLCQNRYCYPIGRWAARAPKIAEPDAPLGNVLEMFSPVNPPPSW